MTSSNGNIFRVTGHLCREFTGHRWIPRTKASDAELGCRLWSAPEWRLSKQSRGWWFETPSRPLWRHDNARTNYVHIDFLVIDNTQIYVKSLSNLQPNVSATVRLFGGDSSHTPFFYWQSFQGNTLHPLAIIHMEDINVLDFDDKSERNLCFFFGNLGIIFNGPSAQLFPPREKW